MLHEDPPISPDYLLTLISKADSKYSYNFTDFVDYLSSNSQKEIRVCNEIVWDGNKPIPKEIVKDVFYNGRDFLRPCKQHMVASFCIALSDIGIVQASLKTYHLQSL